MTTTPEILYFGVPEPRRLGHHLNMPPLPGRYLDYGCQPWGGLDGALLKADKIKDDSGKDGRWTYAQLHGWTVVSFWDRGGDDRPGSNSAFLSHALMSSEDLWRAAWVQWEPIFLRPGWPVRPLLLVDDGRHGGIGFSSIYRGETISIFRELLREDWYIIVQGEHGASYDGYWRDSKEKTVEEAAAEALRGSRLPAAPFIHVAEKTMGAVPALFTAR